MATRNRFMAKHAATACMRCTATEAKGKSTGTAGPMPDTAETRPSAESKTTTTTAPANKGSNEPFANQRILSRGSRGGGGSGVRSRDLVRGNKLGTSPSEVCAAGITAHLARDPVGSSEVLRVGSEHAARLIAANGDGDRRSGRGDGSTGRRRQHLLADLDTKRRWPNLQHSSIR